jgi:hypothetical protein
LRLPTLIYTSIPPSIPLSFPPWSLLHSSTMFECATCDDEFYWQVDCDEHMNDYDHWIECQTCTRLFRTRTACNQHMNAVDHWAPTFDCEVCTSTFHTQHAANQHMNAKGHWLPTVPCETCSTKFHTQQAAENHMRAKGHYRNYCQQCDRRFMNDNCLRQVGQLTLAETLNPFDSPVLSHST